MSLAAILLQRLAASPSIAEVDAASIEHALSRLVTAGTDAWPALVVDPGAFVAYVADRLPQPRPLLEALAAVHGAELYLAFACQAGDRHAIAALERTYAGHIDAVIRGLDGRGMTRDDFRQVVRHKLFVGDANTPPRITAYAGTGSLAAWLRVTARRAGLNAVRGKEVTTEPPADDDVLQFPQSIGDPELDYLKDRYREEFRSAFLDAVSRLQPRQRTLLRQTIAHQLTVRQIGRMYKIHHATAARWIAQARQDLIEGTRRALQERLEVSQRELESIMGLIASRLDVSVMRVLGRDDDAE